MSYSVEKQTGYAWLGRSAGRYALALLLVTVAAVCRYAFPTVLAGTPYLAFYPPVAVAAAIGGFGPGMTAAILSALCVDLVFVPPAWEFNLTDPVEVARVAIFVAGGFAVSVIGGVLRRTREREQEQAEQLHNDIAELRRADDIIRTSESRFRAVFEKAALGIVEADNDGRFIAANDRVCEILGYNRDELLNMNVHDVTAPEDRARSDELNAQLNYGDLQSFDYEKRYLRRDGSKLWVHVTVAAIRDSQGRFLRAIGTIEDISARREAEAKLRLQSAALEAAANGIAITDAKGIVLWANPAFGTMTGYDLREVIGQHTRILKSGKQDDAFYRRMWGTIRQGRVWQGELVNRRKDGSLYHEEMTIAPVSDSAGAITHFIAVKQDISERKTYEEDLIDAKVSAEQAKATAEEATQAKDRFLAVLSHELRTPLTPVLASVSMLQKNVLLSPELQKDLEMIRRNVELEARLIDDLLDLTRIARGKVELNKQSIELCSIIQRAMDVCRPDIEARNLHFNADFGSDAPYRVEADAARLQQVFWNLLKNSIKFTPHGASIELRCYTQGECVVTEVTDSGVGIDAQALPRIFDAFAQADRSITRQFGGLGLGLAISKSLVEMHGGSIEARSEGPGRGSTFTVRLPLLAAGPRAGESSLDTLRSALKLHPAEAQPRQLRLLVVEDHGDTAEMLRTMLESAGHSVTTAGDVQTAVATAGQGGFDLLISDLGLPDGSGIDLIRKLRGSGNWIPAIALSGYGQDSDIQETRSAGFSAHMIKPVDMDRLLTAVAKVAER